MGYIYIQRLCSTNMKYSSHIIYIYIYIYIFDFSRGFCEWLVFVKIPRRIYFTNIKNKKVWKVLSPSFLNKILYMLCCFVLLFRQKKSHKKSLQFTFCRRYSFRKKLLILIFRVDKILRMSFMWYFVWTIFLRKRPKSARKLISVVSLKASEIRTFKKNLFYKILKFSRCFFG